MKAKQQKWYTRNEILPNVINFNKTDRRTYVSQFIKRGCDRGYQRYYIELSPVTNQWKSFFENETLGGDTCDSGYSDIGIPPVDDVKVAKKLCREHYGEWKNPKF